MLAGSLELPIYKTNPRKSYTKYICASACNSTLKDLSIKDIEKCDSDPFWLSSTKINIVKHILIKNIFSNITETLKELNH